MTFFSARLALIAASSFPVLGVAALGADAAHGKVLFQQSCAICHLSGLDPAQAAGQGPALAGVFGRRSAALTDFGYSRALATAHLKWDQPTLDRFLTAPTAVVPGTNMVVAVPNESDRADLIAFLATLKPVRPSRTAAGGPHPRTPGDYQNDAPGASHSIDLSQLPAPFATRSAGNSPKVVDQPAGAHLSVPAGFAIKLYAAGLSGPRSMRTAPNGDLFITETRRNRIRVIRPSGGSGPATANTIFSDRLKGPWGMAFYPAGPNPKWLYVGNLNSVVRIPYTSGDLVARGKPEMVISQLADTTGGHSTRDVAFSPDGTRLFISVGSGSNVAESMEAKSPDKIKAWEATHPRGSTWGNEVNRADVLVTDPEGKTGLKVFAAGIRNAVGLAVQPSTGELWCSTNERDGLGDDLVPDYLTHIQEHGYYGWPWYYLGNHEDPRHTGERPDLAGTALVPDVPVQAHSASLQLVFYPENLAGPAAFPADYSGEIFAAFHGSWNRTGRTGSKVVRVRLKDGKPTGQYDDFVTGFVVDDGHVWGRPVGVAVANDGALFMTDDANGTLWRIAPAGK
jgi:glucose/arabinose dehydrogenase/cytochrome c2